MVVHQSVDPISLDAELGGTRACHFWIYPNLYSPIGNGLRFLNPSHSVNSRPCDSNENCKSSGPPRAHNVEESTNAQRPTTTAQGSVSLLRA